MVSLLEWKPSSKDHDWDGTAVRIPDTLSAFVTFKYRVWFTWYMMQIFLPETGESVSQRREEFWLAAVSGANENFDLWFWEDDDEGYIKRFIVDHRLNLYLEMSMVDWVNACRALDGRRRPSDSVLSQLTPSTRLRFIAWLIVAEVGRKQHLRRNGNIGELHDLIAWWGMSIAYLEVERCEICGVSHLLKIWLETMLEVYLFDDLRSIPWRPECSCFDSELATVVHAGQNWRTDLHPERDSTALRVLFELVVSPWPLILWVAFRVVINDRTDLLQT
ncbi:hypothetical protein B0H13DRAFT_2271140, partial [Mycena leptocephala]